MKTKTEPSRRLDILGNGLSDREIFTATLKRWRQRLGYCSIFAAVPAILASQVSEARSDEVKRTEASVAGRGMRLLEWPNKSCSSTALLKRLSQFRLPHQKGSFPLLTSLAGNDDCPGRSIPGGTYTATAPYNDSGDTTAANNTVTLIGWAGFYCNYYSYNVPGPDHVYSFTLTGLGASPQIKVSRTSGTYEPLVYILDSRVGGCSAGNERCSMIAMATSSPGITATIESGQISFLPLNVPLHLFIDSGRNDGAGSGSYTLRIQDLTIAPASCAGTNSIDCADFFVRQHYLDFLNREPDPPGNAGWQGILNDCPAGDTSCDRIQVSSAFFRSLEFQGRGYFVYRFYSVAFGRKPDFDEFTPDLAKVSGFLTDAELEAAKLAFIAEFMNRPAFLSKFLGLSNTEYVDTLLSTADITHPNRDTWIAALTNGSRTRAQVLREIAESAEVYNKYYNQAFVVMQYFGYLRRQPDALYLTWIAHLDAAGDYRSMIHGFVNSVEYRARFGQ